MKIKTILFASLMVTALPTYADTHCGDLASFAESVASSRDAGIPRNGAINLIEDRLKDIRSQPHDTAEVNELARLSLNIVDAVFYGEHFKYLSPREVGIEFFEYCLDDE